MATSRTGFIRYALLRFIGFAATVTAVAFLLFLMLSGNAGFDSAALAQAIDRLAVTLPLALIALVIALVVGLPAGFIAASRTPVVGAGLMLIARGLIALPAFWLGMALILFVTGVLKLAPPGGFMPWQQNAAGALSSLILPALTLALPLAAVLARRVRRSMQVVAASPELFGARTVGLSTSQATLRQTRSLLPSLAATLGRQLGLLLAGAMIVENVFYLPGLGRLLFEAVAAHDLPVVAAALLVLIALSALGRFAGDLIRAALDPRLVESAA
jgi:peptide/nickel transport system permease protein